MPRNPVTYIAGEVASDVLAISQSVPTDLTPAVSFNLDHDTVVQILAHSQIAEPGSVGTCLIVDGVVAQTKLGDVPLVYSTLLLAGDHTVSYQVESPGRPTTATARGLTVMSVS